MEIKSCKYRGLSFKTPPPAGSNPKENEFMTKGIGTPEIREVAFRVYDLFGGRKIEKVLGRLKREHGIEISKKTLYEWKKEGRWEERMARSDEQGLLTFNEQMLKRVLRLIRKYDVHFAGGGSVKDSQAAYAYINLIRTAMELKRRLNSWETASPPEPATTPRQGDAEGHRTSPEDGIFFGEAAMADKRMS
jgi:hypothetical protein